MSGLLDDIKGGVYANQVVVKDRKSPLPPPVAIDDDEVIKPVLLRLPKRIERAFIDGVCGGRKGNKDRITPSALFEALLTAAQDNPELMAEVLREARKIDGYRKSSACQKRLETQIAARDAD
jgi:hypothetical protein